MPALSSIADIVGGGTPSKQNPAYWGGDIPWVSVKDFKSSSINGSSEYITSAGVKNSATTIIPKGNLIVPTRMALGKVAVNTVDVAINQDLKALLIKDVNVVDRDYLMRVLESKASEIEKKGKGATVKGITLDVLRDLDVPLPPLETQKQIASILEKADQLRKDCQQMEQELKNLAQSVFIELHSSSKKTTMTFNDVASPNKHSFVNGPFGSNLLSSELTDSGVPVIYIRDIASGVYKRKKEVFVTSEKAKELNSCRVDPFDVLITKVGDPPGVAAVYPANEPSAIVTQDVIRIKCDDGICLPGYLAAYMNSAVGAHSLKSIIVEATRSRFGLGDLKKLSIELPSIDTQKSFFKKAEKIDLLMKGANESKIKLDEQFNSLMQKAFSGELKIKNMAA